MFRWTFQTLCKNAHMFVLGHLGLGSALSRVWKEDLPWGWILFGCLLPDIVDKPLYYGAVHPLITGTRTFGHSGILFLCVLLAASIARTRALRAVCVGMTTHVFLDFFLDLIGLELPGATLQAYLFPLLGAHFYVAPFEGMFEHLWLTFHAVPVLIAEIVGSAVFYLEWAKRSSSSWSIKDRRSSKRVKTK